jgi:uncharacterized protein
MAQVRFPNTDREPDPGLTRRDALRNGAALVAGAGIGAQVMAATGAGDAMASALRRAAGSAAKPGYGPLVQHTGEMSIPAGFHVISFGAAGTPMSDGLRTPNFHDGTTCFGDRGGRVRLIRNQEGYDRGHALGKHRAYDRVAQGGVTTSLFDTRSATLVGSALVLNGTDNNCNGGKTPWGSWLSCEESTVGPGEGYERKHGYVFEVPFGAREPVEPVPIKAMGRFEHEACAVDPGSGIVYMTEDNGDPADGFYRYIPHRRGKLHRGGKLQMLAVEGRSRYSTITGQRVGRRLRCEWVTIEDPDPSDAEKRPDAVFEQGRRKGAAKFMGLEGCVWSKGSVHFVASEAGDAGKGQIWRYTPKGHRHGTLVLLYESHSKTVLDEPDTLTVSPRGGVVLCEDGDGEDVDGGDNYLRYLTPAGRLETFARNDTPLNLHRWEDGPKGAIGRSEWSGSTYSPDGKWLFVHLQYPGKTFAITGPWQKGWL